MVCFYCSCEDHPHKSAPSLAVNPGTVFPLSLPPSVSLVCSVGTRALGNVKTVHLIDRRPLDRARGSCRNVSTCSGSVKPLRGTWQVASTEMLGPTGLVQGLMAALLGGGGWSAWKLWTCSMGSLDEGCDQLPWPGVHLLVSTPHPEESPQTRRKQLILDAFVSLGEQRPLSLPCGHIALGTIYPFSEHVRMPPKSSHLRRLFK